MSPFDLKELLWLLMLFPFGIVLSGGVLFAISTVRWVKDRKLRHQLEDLDLGVFISNSRVRQILMDHPCTWLAIKGRNSKRVQRALGLHDATPCSWEEGLVEAQHHKLFVSPPVNGWILVVGSDLPEPDDDVDKCFLFLRHCSRKLGHVQYFSVNRVLNHHAWALLDDGQVFRAYAWAGETLWNQGQKTAAEKELDMSCFGYGDNGITLDFSQKDPTITNAEKVNQLAARWSFDPMSVTENAWQKEQGIVGSLPDFRRE
ncbi:MAG: hypothetical protein JWM68_5774 [Verrucomicrobiales bacterium]|nr:hypothetical protein [Verrucomicrobiales bacterium]